MIMEPEPPTTSDSTQSNRNKLLVFPMKYLILKNRLISISKPCLPAIFELLILAGWAVIVGLPYLIFDPHIIPAGREFGSAIQTHFIWTQVQKCGWCVLWNGNGQGGYPAFVDMHGSMLHPVVILTTLLWGVLKGAKISLVFAFWIGGVAQWWIARQMKVGWLPRMWSAALAMVGGHLAGRMEMGVFGVMFSTALTSLIFGAVLAISRGAGRRAIVLLGVVTASALLSGQGYIQIGLLFLLPVILILITESGCRVLPVWKNYLLALGLGLLMAAPFWLPLIHFLPNFGKFMDPEFTSAQPLSYIPLNLVINDPDFYRSEILGKFSFPYLYTLYIGWVPVVLAMIGFGMGKRNDRRILWFMLGGIAIEFFAASAIPFRWLVRIFPSLAGIRQPSLMAGLAVPLVLGLSAYGLDLVLKLNWPVLWINFSEQITPSRWKIPLQWFLMIPLFFSLQSGFEFTRNWINTDYIGDNIFQLLDALKTDTLQWVNPPFGEHYYIFGGIDKGLKLSPGIRAWQWVGRELPIPTLEAIREVPPDGMVEVTVIDQIGIYTRPDEYYAAVVAGQLQQPCNATGSGGSITVICDTDQSGKLVVKENTWTGWKAWIDGDRVPMTGTQWLEVNAPVGRHTYQFRYQPWDVPLGLLACLVGIVACVYLWFCHPKEATSTKP
jgi:hypothetical protein